MTSGKIYQGFSLPCRKVDGDTQRDVYYFFLAFILLCATYRECKENNRNDFMHQLNNLESAGSKKVGFEWQNAEMYWQKSKFKNNTP